MEKRKEVREAERHKAAVRLVGGKGWRWEEVEGKAERKEGEADTEDGLGGERGGEQRRGRRGERGGGGSGKEEEVGVCEKGKAARKVKRCKAAVRLAGEKGWRFSLQAGERNFGKSLAFSNQVQYNIGKVAFCN